MGFNTNEVELKWGIYKEYQKEYILILIAPQGGAAEGRIPSHIPYVFSSNEIESKWGLIPILIQTPSVSNPINYLPIVHRKCNGF